MSGFAEGKPLYRRPQPGVNMNVDIGSDGIALSPDGKTLYYIALAGRRLFSVPTG